MIKTQQNWPTKEKDLEVAENIIEEYTGSRDDNSLSIFEVVVSENKEAPDIHLSDWVVSITDYFQEKYGVEQGNRITKMVIGCCISHGYTLH